MELPQENTRRTVLKSLGAGVLGGTVLTGSAAAHTEDDYNPPDDEIWLIHDTTADPPHDFEPDSYTAVDATESSGDTITWVHKDESFGGVVHNVHIHHHETNTQLVTGSLKLDDRYAVNFSLEGTNDGTLRLTEVTNGNQSKTIDVSGEGNSVVLGVHCDFHAGQTEGGMKMEKFEVQI